MRGAARCHPEADLRLCAHSGRSADSGGFSEADIAAAQLVGLSCTISEPSSISRAPGAASTSSSPRAVEQTAEMLGRGPLDIGVVVLCDLRAGREFLRRHRLGNSHEERRPILARRVQDRRPAQQDRRPGRSWPEPQREDSEEAVVADHYVGGCGLHYVVVPACRVSFDDQGRFERHGVG
jgi:hypothetical protein